MSSRVLVACVLTFLPLAGEAIRSARNERVLRRRGAVEPPGDVHAIMAVVYPLSFAAMIAEGWRLARPFDASFVVGLIVWTTSKALKYAAIRALGDRWCFRVLVIPGAPLVSSGPYRRLRHPNYVAVIGELLATALLCPAPVTGPLAALAFVVLIRRRVRVEQAALGIASAAVSGSDRRA